MDQAAGLRRRTRAAAAESGPTLLVIGLPEDTVAPARALLHHWAGQGKRWVGRPEAWRIVPVDLANPALRDHLPLLARQQPRWALWVDDGPRGFRRAYQAMKHLAARQGPRRLLAMHPPNLERRGLLSNLQQAAAGFLGVELVVLAR